MINLNTLKAFDLCTKPLNDSYPQCCFIQIEADEDGFTLTATDRFVLLTKHYEGAAWAAWNDLYQTIYKKFDFAIPEYPKSGFLCIKSKRIRDTLQFRIFEEADFLEKKDYSQFAPGWKSCAKKWKNQTNACTVPIFSLMNLSRIEKIFKLVKYDKNVFIPDKFGGQKDTAFKGFQGFELYVMPYRLED